MEGCQISSKLRSHKKEECVRQRGARARDPRFTLKHEKQRTVRGNWLKQLVRHTTLKLEIIAGRTPDVSCAVTMTMNCLLGHPKMTKKKTRTCQPQVKGNWSARLAQLQSSAGSSWVTQKHKRHDAGRSLVGVQHNLLSGLRVCQRRITPALASRKLEVEPLLVVPSLVRELQADGRGDDVDRTMTHEKALTL